MSNVKRFFSSMMMVVVFSGVLVAFATGYKTFFVDAGHAAKGTGEPGSQTAEQAAINASGQANESGTQEASGQLQYAAEAQTPANVAPVSQKRAMQRNVENLERILSNLNDTMQYITTESIATSTAGKDEVASGKKSTASDQKQATPAQDAGLKYDADKITQLHSGMFRIALGSAMLSQLRDNLLDQEDAADQNILNPTQYYTGLYNQTVQNQALLEDALYRMGDVSNLVYLNPYVSEDGLPYDSERMAKLHQSVLKLAEVLAAANALETRFSQQAETYAAYVYAPTNQPMSAAPVEATSVHNPAPAPSSNFFGSFDLYYIAGILPYVFGALFLFGMVGYLLSLAKSRSEAK